VCGGGGGGGWGKSKGQVCSYQRQEKDIRDKALEHERVLLHRGGWEKLLVLRLRKSLPSYYLEEDNCPETGFSNRILEMKMAILRKLA